MNESTGMGWPLCVIKRIFIFLGASLGPVSKKWSRVINVGQVQREFIDIYCHSRYGRAWARSERSVWVERRELRTWASPSTRTCIARTILHACLPMYPARICHCSRRRTRVWARLQAASTFEHACIFPRGCLMRMLRRVPTHVRFESLFWYTFKRTYVHSYWILSRSELQHYSWMYFYWLLLFICIMLLMH